MGPIKMTYLRSFMTIVGLILIVEYRVRGHIMKAKALKNWTGTGKAYQSSYHHGHGPELALRYSNNNDAKRGDCAHTAEETNPWWYVEYTHKIRVERVVIRNRGDRCCNNQFGDVEVYVMKKFNLKRNLSESCGRRLEGNHSNGQQFHFDCSMVGEYVMVYMIRHTYLVLCSVWVYGDIECESGFKRNSYDECLDIDECEYLCNHRHDVCENTYGSYNCTCQEDYLRINDSCEHYRDCNKRKDLCDTAVSTCKKTEAGEDRCICNEGFSATEIGEKCKDIDECSKPELNDCKPRTTCKNTVGSYECECQLGYTLQGDDCLFNNVCKTLQAGDVNKCPEKEVCVPILNAHSCECVDGYERKAKICEDIDECNQDVPACPANRSCENLEGGYVCKLKNDKVDRDCLGSLLLI